MHNFQHELVPRSEALKDQKVDKAVSFCWVNGADREQALQAARTLVEKAGYEVTRLLHERDTASPDFHYLDETEERLEIIIAQAEGHFLEIYPEYLPGAGPPKKAEPSYAEVEAELYDESEFEARHDIYGKPTSSE